ncbi:hypothetical protein GCM10023075_69980 [Streptosporangium album]
MGVPLFIAIMGELNGDMIGSPPEETPGPSTIRERGPRLSPFTRTLTGPPGRWLLPLTAFAGLALLYGVSAPGGYRWSAESLGLRAGDECGPRQGMARRQARHPGARSADPERQAGRRCCSM